MIGRLIIYTSITLLAISSKLRQYYYAVFVMSDMVEFFFQILFYREILEV